MRNLLICLSVLFTISFSSCLLQCEEEVDYVEETKLEDARWQRAQTNYNAEPTLENCDALTAASDEYVESLNGVRDCVSAADIGNFLSTLTLMEEESERRCN